MSKYGFMEVSRVKHGKNIGLRLKREESHVQLKIVNEEKGVKIKMFLYHEH